MNKLHTKALLLEYFTVGYNFLEAFLSIGFGVWAGSIAMVGFGLDSVVESLSAIVLIWRLSVHAKVSPEQEEKYELWAQRFVAVTFFILGAYVLFESVRKLIFVEKPDPSFAGIMIAAVSIIVMPWLSYNKYKLGKKIGSKALVADSKETLVCWVLSITLLVGLALNALFGWWWADPVVGLIIVGFLGYEGVEVWREAGEDEDDDD